MAVAERRKNDAPGQRRKLKKFRKLEVFALMSLLQDLTRHPQFQATPDGMQKLAAQMVAANRHDEPSGKGTAGSSIAAYYEWWRTNVACELPGVRLDPRRAFSEERRIAIRHRDKGVCGVCRGTVVDGDAGEYDH